MKQLIIQVVDVDEDQEQIFINSLLDAFITETENGNIFVDYEDNIIKIDFTQ